MSISVTERQMLFYFLQLNENEKTSVVELIKTFLENRPQAEPLSIEQYNKEIDAIMAEMDAGKFTTQEDLEEEMKAW